MKSRSLGRFPFDAVRDDFPGAALLRINSVDWHIVLGPSACVLSRDLRLMISWKTTVSISCKLGVNGNQRLPRVFEKGRSSGGDRAVQHGGRRNRHAVLRLDSQRERGRRGLTRSLAAELAPLIRVNAIAPSLTDTPLAQALLADENKRNAAADRHPLKRVGDPGEIADMAFFLLSDASSWITGQIISADGGLGSVRTFK